MTVFFTHINRFLNIHHSEWPRFSMAWCLNFFYRTGFVIGWTVLVSMFVSQAGVTNLPILFLINAIFVMMGSGLFSIMIHHVKKEWLMIGISLLASLTLFMAIMAAKSNELWFFGISLLAESILLSQLGILISIFNEDLFTPLESQRLFPLIESAETIGSIVAGIILGTLASTLPTFKFMYIWVLLILGVTVIVFCYLNYTEKVPFLGFKKHTTSDFGQSLSELPYKTRNMTKIPFIKGLFILVLCQWMFVNLLDFQYTRVIQSYISGNEARMVETHPNSQGQISMSGNTEEINPMPKLKSGTPIKNHEQDLTQTLGRFAIIFSVAALLTQLLATSRIIKSLGIIGSMLLYPVLMFLNMVGLSLRFTVFSAVTTKTNFEIVSTIQKNAYHSSYYALNTAMREQAKELLEGLAKPLGAVIGVAMLFALKYFWPMEKLTLGINTVMVFILGMVFITIWHLQKQYTGVAKYNLKQKGNRPSKFNAIEILSQKGHKQASKDLCERLSAPEESEEVKVKILSALGEIKDHYAIPDLLDCLDSASKRIRKASLEALNRFPPLGEAVFTEAFSRYRTITTLKRLFVTEESDEIRQLVIKLMVHFNQSDVVDFLLQTLKKSKNPDLQAHCIYACGLFHDPNTAYYLKPYLSSPHPKIKASVIESLWQFSSYQPFLKTELDKLLSSSKINNKIEAIKTIGYLKLRPYLDEFLQYTEAETDRALYQNAVIALGLLGEVRVVDLLVQLVFDKDLTVSEHTRKCMGNMSEEIRKKINQIIHQNVSNQINQLITESKKTSLAELPMKTLHKLKRIYSLINAQAEVLKVEDVINQKYPISNY